MTMRYKIAAGLYERRRIGIPNAHRIPAFDDQTQEIKEDYLAEADTALNQLMEPTAAMMNAGMHANGPGQLGARDSFQAMIRAAKEGK